MTTFDYDGKSYELKMTRAGAAAAEEAGLRTSEIAEKPFSAIYLLFFAALHSYRVSPQKARKMLDDLLEDGTLAFASVFEELAEAYGSLFE